MSYITRLQVSDQSVRRCLDVIHTKMFKKHIANELIKQTTFKPKVISEITLVKDFQDMLKEGRRVFRVTFVQKESSIDQSIVNEAVKGQCLLVCDDDTLEYITERFVMPRSFMPDGDVSKIAYVKGMYITDKSNVDTKLSESEPPSITDPVREIKLDEKDILIKNVNEESVPSSDTEQTLDTETDDQQSIITEQKDDTPNDLTDKRDTSYNYNSFILDNGDEAFSMPDMQVPQLREEIGLSTEPNEYEEQSERHTTPVPARVTPASVDPTIIPQQRVVSRLYVAKITCQTCMKTSATLCEHEGHICQDGAVIIDRIDYPRITYPFPTGTESLMQSYLVSNFMRRHAYLSALNPNAYAFMFNRGTLDWKPLVNEQGVIMCYTSTVNGLEYVLSMDEQLEALCSNGATIPFMEMMFCLAQNVGTWATILIHKGSVGITGKYID